MAALPLSALHGLPPERFESGRLQQFHAPLYHAAMKIPDRLRSTLEGLIALGFIVGFAWVASYVQRRYDPARQDERRQARWEAQHPNEPLLLDQGRRSPGTR